LKRIETQVFEGFHLSLIVPSTILFIASDAAPDPLQISIADIDSCPEYGRWQQLRRQGQVVDFRRICRSSSDLSSLSDRLLNHCELSEGPDLSESDGISTRIYQGRADDFRIIVKSINLSRCVENCEVEKAIGNMMNLRHPCIAGLIGIVFRPPLRELQIVEICSGVISLSKVISTSPEWWTSTAKAKAVVGLVLGLRFVHSFGLLHGHLTMDNILFDEDGIVQISDFCMNSFAGVEGDQDVRPNVGGFWGEDWMSKADVCAFARILSTIVVGVSADPGVRDPSVPSFVSDIIERGRSADSRSTESFANILRILKENDFKIVESVDVQEVSDFVDGIEWSETLIE
jgi:hypothetical protein